MVFRRRGGAVHKFDDLPPPYVANVSVTEVPYNRQVGDQPALTPAEIDDVVAFLQTLTDGFNLIRFPTRLSRFAFHD